MADEPSNQQNWNRARVEADLLVRPVVQDLRNRPAVGSQDITSPETLGALGNLSRR